MDTSFPKENDLNSLKLLEAGRLYFVHSQLGYSVSIYLPLCYAHSPTAEISGGTPSES